MNQPVRTDTEEQGPTSKQVGCINASLAESNKLLLSMLKPVAWVKRGKSDHPARSIGHILGRLPSI
jgi:hypothetical protein